MVYNNTMVRVQIYLSEDELALLDRAGTTSGASRSESIRRAVRHTYGERSLDDRLRALDDSAGAWADRPMGGAEYVDSIRGDLGRRLEGLGLD